MNDKTQEKNGIWGDDDEEEKEEVDEGDEKIDKTKNTLKTEKNTSIIFKDEFKSHKDDNSFEHKEANENSNFKNSNELKNNKKEKNKVDWILVLKILKK